MTLSKQITKKYENPCSCCLHLLKNYFIFTAVNPQTIETHPRYENKIHFSLDAGPAAGAGRL